MSDISFRHLAIESFREFVNTIIVDIFDDGVSKYDNPLSCSLNIVKAILDHLSYYNFEQLIWNAPVLNTWLTIIFDMYHFEKFDSCTIFQEIWHCVSYTIIIWIKNKCRILIGPFVISGSSSGQMKLWNVSSNFCLLFYFILIHKQAIHQTMTHLLRFLITFLVVASGYNQKIVFTVVFQTHYCLQPTVKQTLWL